MRNPDTTPSAEHDARRWYFLEDRFANQVLARILATPETIKMLNKPQWMKSRGWKYCLFTDLQTYVPGWWQK